MPDENVLSLEKIGDLVRDAFYEGRELGAWPRTLTETDKFSAWLGSASRCQMFERAAGIGRSTATTIDYDAVLDGAKSQGLGGE